jgi:hypothetical protein
MTCTGWSAEMLEPQSAFAPQYAHGWRIASRTLSRPALKSSPPINENTAPVPKPEPAMIHADSGFVSRPVAKAIPRPTSPTTNPAIPVTSRGAPQACSAIPRLSKSACLCAHVMARYGASQRCGFGFRLGSGAGAAAGAGAGVAGSTDDSGAGAGSVGSLCPSSTITIIHIIDHPLLGKSIPAEHAPRTCSVDHRR